MRAPTEGTTITTTACGVISQTTSTPKKSATNFCPISFSKHWHLFDPYGREDNRWEKEKKRKSTKHEARELSFLHGTRRTSTVRRLPRSSPLAESKQHKSILFSFGVQGKASLPAAHARATTTTTELLKKPHAFLSLAHVAARVYRAGARAACIQRDPP